MNLLTSACCCNDDDEPIDEEHPCWYGGESPVILENVTIEFTWVGFAEGGGLVECSSPTSTGFGHYYYPDQDYCAPSFKPCNHNAGAPHTHTFNRSPCWFMWAAIDPQVTPAAWTGNPQVFTTSRLRDCPLLDVYTYQNPYPVPVYEPTKGMVSVKEEGATDAIWDLAGSSNWFCQGGACCTSKTFDPGSNCWEAGDAAFFPASTPYSQVGESGAPFGTVPGTRGCSASAIQNLFWSRTYTDEKYTTPLLDFDGQVVPHSEWKDCFTVTRNPSVALPIQSPLGWGIGGGTVRFNSSTYPGSEISSQPFRDFDNNVMIMPKGCSTECQYYYMELNTGNYSPDGANTRKYYFHGRGKLSSFIAHFNERMSSKGFTMSISGGDSGQQLGGTVINGTTGHGDCSSNVTGGLNTTDDDLCTVLWNYGQAYFLDSNAIRMKSRIAQFVKMSGTSLTGVKCYVRVAKKDCTGFFCGSPGTGDCCEVSRTEACVSAAFLHCGNTCFNANQGCPGSGAAGSLHLKSSWVTNMIPLTPSINVSEMKVNLTSGWTSVGTNETPSPVGIWIADTNDPIRVNFS